MPKRGENIYKRKDGRWEGRIIKSYHSNGKPLYKSVYGKTYKEVKQKIESCKLRREQEIKTEKKGQNPGSLRDYLDFWLILQRNRVKESTYIKYYNLIQRHIVPALGNNSIDNLSTSLIEKFTNEKLTDGRLDKKGGLSEKTVKDILTVLHGALKDYTNITKHESTKDIHIIYPKEKMKEIKILSAVEQQKMENCLMTAMDNVKMGILICLYTGMRIGELCALQWEDIDFANRCFNIRKTMQRVQSLQEENRQNEVFHKKTKIIITEPKSRKSIRLIPIMEFVLDILEQFRPENQKAYLLTGTEQYMEPRTLQYRFKKYLKECSLENVTFHALRHTFASRCIEKGVDVKSLSEILGHASVNITLDRYVHSSFELKLKNMELLNQMYYNVHKQSEAPSYN